VKAPRRPLSASCLNCALASRNRLNRNPSAKFSVLRSASLIFSGRVPLVRFQNSRNGGSSGARRKIAAGRLSGLAPPRALRPGTRREERLRVFVIASAQRAAWKSRGAVACGTQLVGSYPSPANQTLAEFNPDKLNICAVFDSTTARAQCGASCDLWQLDTPTGPVAVHHECAAFLPKPEPAEPSASGTQSRDCESHIEAQIGTQFSDLGSHCRFLGVC